MNEKNISKKLCELRKENKLTQLQLAEKLNVSDKTISKWETGVSLPDIEMIKRICEAFNVKTSEFLEEVTKKPRKKLEFNKMFPFLMGRLIRLSFIILVFTLVLFFFNNYNTINIYEIRTDDSEISIDTGYFVRTNHKNTLAISNIRVKNIDYEVISSKIKIYTFIDNNKTYFYENDIIENVIIDERTKQRDMLTKKIVKQIPKYLNIEIEFIDNKSVKHTYKTKLLLKEEYSNKFFVNPKNSASTPEEVEVKKVPMVEAVTLLNIGFKKIDKANIYWKKLKHYDLYFDIESEKMYYSFEKEKVKYSYTYKYGSNILNVTKTKQDKYIKNHVLENYEYYILKDELDCKEGKCTDYLKILKEMQTVFNDTLGIKQ